MNQIMGHFSNQKEAERAVNALAAASLDDTAIHTIEEWNAELEPEPVMMLTLLRRSIFSGNMVGRS